MPEDIMLEYIGKYTSCQVMIDVIEEECVKQIYNFLNCPAFEGAKIRIMPDCHAGAGAVIGFTSTLTDKVIPNVIGVDIGCFTGDTKIPLLNGMQATLEELEERGGSFFVYSYDINHRRVVPGHARAVKTRQNAELLEVGISGGDVIRCTPDHNFLLLDGTYVEAKDLKPFMSLMPLYRFYTTRDGYETVWADDKTQTTHLMVDKFFHGPREKTLDVHHKDGTWWNNDPRNLVRVEHTSRTIHNKGNWAQHRSGNKCNPTNHKVLWARKLSYREDVYCLQVDTFQNFALSAGVFVHNCGVASYKLGVVDPDFAQLDRYIRDHIPSGFNVNERIHPKIDETADDYRKVARDTEQDENRVVKSLKSLGGGNHFIEVGRDNTGSAWLTIHSGSRNFGLKIANWHQAKAIKTVGKGHGLEWLEGEDANYYLEHMKIAQRFAAENRRLMAEQILRFFSLKLDDVETVESIHNYINFEDRILRKGAISAHVGERVIIPWNMRDGLVIGRGKGNVDWNFSAPHGAGRVMGRGQAKRTLDLEKFKESMDGIWTSCVSKDTLDESPMVYKDHAMIQEAIGDTVDVELTVKPLYNFKAGVE
jgi:tRNA-splicing ligase RtcB (3'-phosphate/5'-hydroxy nucleic acid ligase)